MLSSFLRITNPHLPARGSNLAAIARPCIAKRQIEIAIAESAGYVSHGSDACCRVCTARLVHACNLLFVEC